MTMLRLAAVVTFLCLAFSLPGMAQDSDAQPSKDEVILYLRTMHSHDMVQRMAEAMVKPMRQMLEVQFQKDGKRPPADFEAMFTKMMDDMTTNMPWDEMTQATVPVYQRHFTKTDIANLNAFYTSPTGQKLLQELPDVTAESMQAMMPIMREYIAKWQLGVQRQVKEMEKTAPTQ